MISSGKLLQLLSAAALAASILPRTSCAQATSHQSYENLATAFALNISGHPAQAVGAVEGLLASGTLSRIEKADALDLEGMCYIQLDQLDKAIHALESAHTLLAPSDQREEAAILNNLGRVYVAKGDYAVAEHLFERAFRLYGIVGDHGGMARAASSQAGVALSQMKNRNAGKYLTRSDHEAKLARNLDRDDLAAIASLHAWLALNRGDAKGGVQACRNALRLWTESHGEQHPLTAWGTFLLGQAEAMNGQWDEGARIMEKGITMTRRTVGDRSRRFLDEEASYAKLLDQKGQSRRAAELGRDVQNKQALPSVENCRNCVSVVALR